MKSFIIYVFILLNIVALQTDIKAQSYRTALGVRVGSDFGLSLNQSIWKRLTCEGIYISPFNNELINGNNNNKVLLLVKRHQSILSKRFNVFAGIGYGRSYSSIIDVRHNLLPIQVGAEMTIGRFNFSLDYLPLVSFGQNEEASGNNLGFSVRYVLLKRKKKKPIKKLLEGIKKKG